jgi:cyclohexyl-isocyanide hydratase
MRPYTASSRNFGLRDAYGDAGASLATLYSCNCRLGLVPTHTFADGSTPRSDLHTGGSEGVAGVLKDRETIAFVRYLGANSKYVTSVCTGSFVLGVAGLLKGQVSVSL